MPFPHVEQQCAGKAADCAPVTRWLSTAPLVFWGPRLDVDFWRDGIQISTPVGHPCVFCGDSFVEGESGVLIALDCGDGPSIEQSHNHCGARAILGSPAHLAGTCLHGTGEEPVDERSWREQGREVFEMWAEDPSLYAIRLNDPYRRRPLVMSRAYLPNTRAIGDAYGDRMGRSSADSTEAGRAR